VVLLPAKIAATGAVGAGICSATWPTTEIAGIGCPCSFRRGAAGALTTFIQGSFCCGYPVLIWLHEAEERLYARAGFSVITGVNPCISQNSISLKQCRLLGKPANIIDARAREVTSTDLCCNLKSLARVICLGIPAPASNGLLNLWLSGDAWRFQSTRGYPFLMRG